MSQDTKNNDNVTQINTGGGASVGDLRASGDVALHDIVNNYNFFPNQTSTQVTDNAVNELDEACQRDREIYEAYITEWEQKSSLSEWHCWTYGLLASQPCIPVDICNKLNVLPQWILCRVWPKRHVELEDAFVNFQLILTDLLYKFFEHAEKINDQYQTRKFYNGKNGWNDNYDRDLHRYEFHVDVIHDLTFELTRSANYICDHARNYVSSKYRVDEGRLLIRLDYELDYIDCCPEYQGAERINRPYPGLKKFLLDRKQRDLSVGDGIEPKYQDVL